MSKHRVRAKEFWKECIGSFLAWADLHLDPACHVSRAPGDF